MTSRYVHLHEDRLDRSYAPSLYDSGEDGIFLNDVHAGVIDEVAAIHGKLQAADHHKLYEMAYFAQGPLLEIGRSAGKSTTLIALGLRDADKAHIPFYSIELSLRYVAEAEDALNQRGLREFVTFIQGDSAHEVGRLRTAFDTVFVDGDHSYYGVSRDLLALTGRIAPNGSVMFHDYFDPRNDDPDNHDYGVRDAVEANASDAGLEFRGRFGAIGLFECLRGVES